MQSPKTQVIEQPAQRPQMTAGEVNYRTWQTIMTGTTPSRASYRQISVKQRSAWEAGAKAVYQELAGKQHDDEDKAQEA